LRLGYVATAQEKRPARVGRPPAAINFESNEDYNFTQHLVYVPASHLLGRMEKEIKHQENSQQGCLLEGGLGTLPAEFGWCWSNPRESFWNLPRVGCQEGRQSRLSVSGSLWGPSFSQRAAQNNCKVWTLRMDLRVIYLPCLIMAN
jgi:hypothetical protein